MVPPKLQQGPAQLQRSGEDWMTSFVYCRFVGSRLSLLQFSGSVGKSESGDGDAENICSRRLGESPVGAHIPPPHADMVHGEDTVYGSRPEEVGGEI